MRHHFLELLGNVEEDAFFFGPEEVEGPFFGAALLTLIQTMTAEEKWLNTCC